MSRGHTATRPYDIVDGAIFVLRIVRHAKVDHLTLVNGYPLAGPLGQIVAASGSIPT